MLLRGTSVSKIMTMPKIQEVQLHPLEWETNSEEERFKLSTLDYLSTVTYTNSAFFFRLTDEEKP